MYEHNIATKSGVMNYFCSLRYKKILVTDNLGSVNISISGGRILKLSAKEISNIEAGKPISMQIRVTRKVFGLIPIWQIAI